MATGNPRHSRDVGCKEMMKIRQASESDIAQIASFDHVAQVNEARREFIARSVRSGSTWVAVSNRRVTGYAVLEYTFYSRGFISMLYVHPDYRRRGIGTALVQRVESVCGTDTLFTSTNESNRPMQAFMVKLQYSPSGVINNLDEGDPEIVYFKKVSKEQPTTLCSGRRGRRR